jgi:DMSO reductase anchor subunit
VRPAYSIVFFTTLAGTAQGLVVAIAMADLTGIEMSRGFLLTALAVAGGLLVSGLGASFFHLGRPERAWRTVLMWRTSWMSREVIVLPAFIAVVASWWLALAAGAQGMTQSMLPLLAIIGAALLWYCTAMIYACVRFIQEWAHPLTLINFTLIGLSSGLMLGGALGAVSGEAAFVHAVGPWALATTLAAWSARTVALRRNARLKPKSTLQSATGIRSTTLTQKSMGMSAGSFNTREFFHGAAQVTMQQAKLGFILFGFALPTALLVWALPTGSMQAWLIAFPVQYLGLLAERWFFFAQAQHPQNLYYQVIS